MSRIDYSKWNHIEVSDDEDDTHPNVDTPSLFRMRHKARVRRMEKAAEEKEEFQSGKKENLDKLQETRNRLERLRKEGGSEAQISVVENELKELEEDQRKWKEKEEEIAKKERLTPWNVDTLSHDGFQKTLINKYKKEVEESATEEESMARQKLFMERHENEMKEFGMYRRLDDSERYLLQHTHLACEFTSQYLAIWCMDLEDEGKSNLVDQVAHQTIIMQYLLALAKNMKADPRACIRPFFMKMKKAEVQYQSAFNEELEAFKVRVKETAKDRRRITMKLAKEKESQAEEERRARLGPGGLDPLEVMESLPKDMKLCFETNNVPLLQETLSRMSLKEAEYHMDRCEKAGLWTPAANARPAGQSDDNDNDDDGEEEIYHDAQDH